jgi:hypothetical protein
MASDGLPIELDGQRVYRVPDQSAWQNLSGSFLLAARLGFSVIGCGAPGMYGRTQADHDLLGNTCGGVTLWPTSIEGSGLPSANTGVPVAPKGSALAKLSAWRDHPVVVRVHAHDPEASQCSPDLRNRCDSTVVFEAVVWPTVPPEVDGERVFSLRRTTYGDLKSAGLS